MIPGNFRDRARCLVAIAVIIPMSFALAAVSVNFEHAGYAGKPGDDLTLRIAFDAPIPEGLDAYSLRLDFPEGLFDVRTVTIVAELDNDLFAENPASREIHADHVTVRGFAEIGNLYHGTAFVEIEASIGIDAPAGRNVLALGVPHENSFINGAMSSIDADLDFGIAEVTVDVPRPILAGLLQSDAATGAFGFNYAGFPGRSYTLMVSGDLKEWDLLDILTTPPSGVGVYSDSEAVAHPRRFYRLVD